jgi:hypothetical protein
MECLAGNDSLMKQRFGSIAELVAIFSDCLRALTPHVVRVGIEWQEGKNYDDWDAIAQTLYAAVVANTVAYTVEGEGFKPLARYGLIMPDYAEESFLYSARLGPDAVFLKLVGSEKPFDMAVFLELDGTSKPTGKQIRIPLQETEIHALLRSADEQRELVKVIIEEKWD